MSDDTATEATDGLDEETLNRYNENRRWHRKHGRPDKALRIELAMAEGRRLTDDEARTLLGLNAPKNAPADIDPEVQIPPRHGPGSSTANWRKFARLVTDMDEDVLKKTGKNDLIKILEANGVIEREK